MKINDRVRYKHDGSWYDAEIVEYAYWVQEDAYWIRYKDDDGLTRITIAYENDLVFLGNGVKCTCGITASGGGFHSNWCDRYKAGIKVN
jgi:hypothetical protein